MDLRKVPIPEILLFVAVWKLLPYIATDDETGRPFRQVRRGGGRSPAPAFWFAAAGGLAAYLWFRPTPAPATQQAPALNEQLYDEQLLEEGRCDLLSPDDPDYCEPATIDADIARRVALLRTFRPAGV